MSQRRDHEKAMRNLTFRAGTGAVIINAEGFVLGLERCDIPGAWQFPQGGLDEGETPLETVKREILEETGIKEEDLQLLASAPRWLAYELPEEARSPKIGRGQVQRWFLFRFKGSDEEITLGDQKEFIRWQWITMDEMVSKIVSFKQSVYKELAKDFERYINQ
jgi:putative (di)nucleoside polyphosphate hydrolase